jgi:hypothetical protein
MEFVILIAIVVGLFLLIVHLTSQHENKYTQALERLKQSPDNRTLYFEVLELGRQHMENKRQQFVGHMMANRPGIDREDFVKEAYRLYNDHTIHEDIYRVVGRKYP